MSVDLEEPNHLTTRSRTLEPLLVICRRLISKKAPLDLKMRIASLYLLSLSAVPIHAADYAAYLDSINGATAYGYVSLSIDVSIIFPL